MFDGFGDVPAAAENLVFLDDENLEGREAEAGREVERNDLDRDVLENLADAERLVRAFGEDAYFPAVLDEVRQFFL